MSVSAHTNGNLKHSNSEKCKDKQENGQEGKIQTLPAQVDFYEEGAIKQESLEFEDEEISNLAPQAVDTTSSTISKYNYLFYFIYKYKFENKFGGDQIERLITD